MRYSRMLLQHMFIIFCCLTAITLFASTVLYAADNQLQQKLNNYRLSPFPASLESKRGVHPRIFLDKARITELKLQIKTTHKSLFEETLRQADRAVQDGAPEYRGNGDGEGRWGFEQLWQRNVGNYMSTLAMAWVLTKDRKYLDSARQVGACFLRV